MTIKRLVREMLRVGFYQFYPAFGEVEKNLRQIVKSLSAVEADLIVLPELVFTGYHFTDRSEAEQLAEHPSDSRTVEMLSDLSLKKDMIIVSGFAEKSGDKLYNSSVLIGPQGLIHIYRKIQLFYREKEIFDPGDTPPTVHQIKGTKVGMMICFDWIFPEISRILALKGAEIICHPSNLVLNYCQKAMITRCLENNFFAITANRYGTDYRPHGKLRFTGQSQIVAPKGELIYRAKSRQEEIYITEIDPSIARDKKITELNDLMRDRRPDFYRDICS
ncbi:MAG: acyltransferase [Calditrichaeota bacterium]|nr:acyltransferase [Calditrichota bacterium]RQW04776.1 MAG: acyltransferase [Calditrichota bacterium]